MSDVKQLIAEFRAKREKATQGEWWRIDPPWGNGDTVHVGPTDDPHSATAFICTSVPRDDDLTEQSSVAEDMEFIAFAANNAAAICDAVEALAWELTTVKAEAGARDVVEENAWRCMAAINTLRMREGDTVTILCDNADFNGLPNCAVECNGDWTAYEDRWFGGDTLADALEKAVVAYFASSGETYEPPKSLSAAGTALLAKCSALEQVAKLVEEVPTLLRQQGFREAANDLEAALAALTKEARDA